jgi:hypothetical protein
MRDLKAKKHRVINNKIRKFKSSEEDKEED